MKKFKKIMAVLVAAVLMISSFTLTAFAAGEASITITRDTTYSSNMDPDESGVATYSIYKIFDASYDANVGENTQADTGTIANSGTRFAYTIDANSPWVAKLGSFSNGTWSSAQGQNWVTLSPTSNANKYQVNAVVSFDDADTAIAFANWLKTNKGVIDATATKNAAANDSSVQFTNLDRGYYLIDSNVGSNLVLATSALNIIEKNTYPGIVKTVAAGNESSQIGDTVEFTITITIPSGANKDIIVTDEMSEGLSFKEITSVLNNNDTPGNVTYTTKLTKDDASATTLTPENVKTNGNKFVIVLASAQVIANAGKTITISYKATLNKDATVQGTDANTNKAELDFGNFHSKESQVGVDTQKIMVNKVDSTDQHVPKAQIAGAVFEVRLNNGTSKVNLMKVSDTVYRVADITQTGVPASHALKNDQTATISANQLVSDFVTVADTPITIEGLDADVTYKLVEIQAPAGYLLQTGAIDAKPVTTVDSPLTLEATNTPGAALPNTGGMGTTVLYIVGGMLVVLAGAYLFFSRKRTA